MKGWGQIYHSTALAVVEELARVAPDSPVLVRAKLIFDLGDEAGIKPSGRRPGGKEAARREKLIERIAERDRDDAEIKRLYGTGLSLLQVANRMGYGANASRVKDSLDRTGTPTRPKGPPAGSGIDRARIERFRVMRAQGKTLEEIGGAEHISRERVRQICLAAGIHSARQPQ